MTAPRWSPRPLCPRSRLRSVGTGTAVQLLSDGLDLKFRLPLVNRGVESLRVAPWRARRIARMTHGLSLQAARYVDEQLAPVADSCGVARIDRLVTEAIAMLDTEQQEAVEDEAEAAWGARLDHATAAGWTGTSRLEVVGNTRP